MAQTKRRVKTKAIAAPVPQSREEATEALAEIGRRQRERERIQASMNDDIAEIKTKYEEEARPHNEQIAGLTEGLHAWCEAHRAELTNGGKVKSANMASGDVGWRITPPKVRVTGKAAVIELLKALKLKRFIRLKEDVNKEAMLAEPDKASAVKGVNIVQTEEFWLRPFETELEEVTSK